MALIENTDFSQKQQVDMAAIASLYQKKAAMEAEMKVQKEQIRASKQQRLMDVMNMAASMSTKMIDARAAKQQKDAQQNVFDTLAMTDKSINKATPVPAGQEGPMQMEQVRFGDTPQFKTQLETGLAKAFPKEYGEQKIKSLLEGAEGAKPLSGRDIQQKNVILADGTRTSLQLFETVPSKKYGTSVTWTDLSGNEIDPKLLAGAVEAPAPTVMIDPTTGRPMITERVGPNGGRDVSTPGDKAAGGTPGEGGMQELLAKSPKMFDAVEKIRTESFPQMNKPLETAVNGVSASAKVKALLKAEGDKLSQTGIKSLGFGFAVMSGSNSQLSDKERESFEEPLSLIDKVVNQGYKLTQGDLSPKMRKDLLNLADVLEKKSRIQAQKYLNSNKQRAKSLAGSYWNDSIGKAFPTLDQVSVSFEDIAGEQNDSALPEVGGTYNGAKVLKVERVD